MNYDYHFFSEHIKTMSSIVSVEVFPDGTYGNIRLVTANSAYMNVIDETFDKVGEKGIHKTEFVPDQPYEKYIPKDKNFEEFCYRSAILGETLHTYIRPDRMPVWLYLTAIPLVSDKENVGYCAYLQSYTETPDFSLMANIAPDTASNVLSICMKLRGANDFETALDEVIVDIGKICKAEHCCILLADSAQRKCRVLCEALSEDTKLASMKKYVDDDFITIVDTWHDTIAGSTCAIIKDDADWEELKKTNPVWYNSIQPAGAKSIVLFPLKYRSDTLGYIWAINFDVSYTLKIKEMLELTTYFIASEIASHQLFSRLEILSSMDMLTGVYNRNAMNNRVDRLIAEGGDDERVGIIFTDLNGLKQVNDEKGHFAGDILLKNAAIKLQMHFHDLEIYRAGGDEFMVLAVDPDDDEFERRVQSFREDCSDPEGICFAVGECCDTAKNISRTMSTADQRMYADKQAFYERFPERKYRR